METCIPLPLEHMYMDRSLTTKPIEKDFSTIRPQRRKPASKHSLIIRAQTNGPGLDNYFPLPCISAAQEQVLPHLHLFRDFKGFLPYNYGDWLYVHSILFVQKRGYIPVQFYQLQRSSIPRMLQIVFKPISSYSVQKQPSLYNLTTNPWILKISDRNPIAYT